jgi:hypothetical protein
LASAIGWKLILKHRKRFDPRGGTQGGQVEANLRAVEELADTSREPNACLGETAVLAFQVIGWVLIGLFFAAMIGGHRGVANRHVD